MSTLWFVVAHRAGARIFEQQGREEPMLKEEIFHPAGRLKTAELDSDRPGVSYESVRPGVHALANEEWAHDKSAREFAHTLAGRLDKARTQQHLHGIVLVAEPKFLGLLRQALSRESEKLVRGTVAKDLAAEPTAALSARLPELW